MNRRSSFFVWIAVAMLVVIALGFGRSFYLRPVYISEPLPTYLIVHGTVLTAWYLLFLVQSVLVNTRRVRLHRGLGVAGIVIAAGVAVTGVMVHLHLIPRLRARGELTDPEALARAVDFALAGVASLFPFVVLVVLALLLRRNGAVHKRLMFWAMVWTIGPAFSEVRPLGQMLDPLVAPWLPYFPSDLLWLAAILGYDWKTLRRIHPATWLTFVALAFFYLVATDWIVGNHTLQNWLRGYLQIAG